jgi:hypothetical protein
MHYRNWKAWPQEEVDKLIEMRNKGLTLKEIAKELGRSTGAVSRKCHDYGIPSINEFKRRPKPKTQTFNRGSVTLPKLQSLRED